MVSIYCTGTSNIFDNNTIHTTGASATVLPGEEINFSVIIKLQIPDFYNQMVLYFKVLKTMLKALLFIIILFMILKNMLSDMMRQEVMHLRLEVME